METKKITKQETVTVELDMVDDDEKTTQYLEQLVETTKSIQEIKDDITKKRVALEQNLTDTWGDELGDLMGMAANLKDEIDRLTEGKGFKHPDGHAELVLKTKPRRGGKVKDETLAIMETDPVLYGPPSNFFIEVPATMKLRGMAEVDKTVTALDLDDEGRAELFKLLNISGGDKYTELVIHEVLDLVTEAIEAERGGGT